MPDRPSRPGERVAIAAADLTDAEMARIMASVPDGPGYDLADIAEEAEYDPASIRHLARIEPTHLRPGGHLQGGDGSDWLALSPEGADLYPIEDGPGSGRRIEVTVRVLVGTERSTIIVADPVTGRALVHQVVPHGAEAGVASAAVASLVEDGIAEGSRDV